MPAVWILLALGRMFLPRRAEGDDVAIDFVHVWRPTMGVLLFTSCMFTGGFLKNEGFGVGALVAASFALLFLAMTFPATVITTCLVPLGLARGAWALYAAAGGAWSRDERPTAGLLLAAAAIARQRQPSEAALRFVEQRLARALELRSNGIVAAAALALARGDRERACLLCRTIADEAPGELTYRARCMAREILVLDAAERGAWAEVRRFAGPRRMGRLVALVRKIAARLGDEDRPSQAALVIAWLVAPRRRRTWPMVKRALAATAPPLPPAVDDDALGAHRALLARDPALVGRAEVEAVCARVDALRKDAAHVASIARRALALGAQLDALVLRDELVRAVEEDLARLVVAARLSLPAGKGMTQEAVRTRVHDERFALLEALVQDLDRRRRSGLDLPEADEWCALQRIREAAEVLWSGATAAERRTVFDAVYGPVCNFCVRLNNIRGRRWQARATFAWLLILAQGGGSRDEVELLDRNVRSCAADRLPYADEPKGEPIGGGKRRLNPGHLWLAAVALAAGAELLLARYVDPDFGPLMFFTLFIGVIAVIAAYGNAKKKTVEASLTPNGLFTQRRIGAWNVPFEDIAAVRPSRIDGKVLVVRLWRAPDWLGRTLHVVAPPHLDAREVEGRLVELMRAKEGVVA
jgi:hypothetical protein